MKKRFSEFVPKLYTVLREEGIARTQWPKEILSGIIVGVVALPLAIAFAIASGVSPEKGLVTAILAGFIISAFGGSRVQIGGPTGAFIVIVLGVVQQYGVDGLIVATFLAGFLIIGLGLARVGNYLKFVSYPLIVGFTSGIAVIIFSSQIKEFLGLPIEQVPSGFVQQWGSYITTLEQTNFYALGLASITVLLTLFFKHVSGKIPGSIVAIVLTTALAQYFDLPVATIESRFGEIPNSFSAPKIPQVDFEVVRQLLQPAFAIALLGAIESLLSAVVADGMIGSKHRSNMELVAQGAANVVSAIFGGIPATGAIARTATNIRNGARTPIAGIVHALTLLLIMLVLAPVAKLIPLACLAGILVVVAYNMSEWRQFRSILHGNRSDIVVLITTFVLTVAFDLVIAIEIGLVLSSFLFLKRMSEALDVRNPLAEKEHGEQLFDQELRFDPREVLLYEINGPLFFGAAQQFYDTVSRTDLHTRVVILRMRYVPFIDTTGLQRLRELIHLFEQRNMHVLFSGVSDALRRDMQRGGLFATVGEETVFGSIQEALAAAHRLVEKTKA